MASLIWTEPALQDLDAIADYIALDKPDAAREFVKQVFEKVGLLSRFPKMGTTPPEIRSMPYRQIVISPCRIFYKEEGKRVFILHVMRGEQQLDEDMLEDRDKKK